MKILDIKNGKMLLGILTSSRERNENGFFQEIDEKDVPKNIQKFLKNILGGAGSITVGNRKYFFSNTAGETSGKFFLQVADRIKFAPKNHIILEKLNDETNFLKGAEIISKALERGNLKFQFNHWVHDYYSDKPEKNHIKCKLKLILNKNDYTNLKHPFENEQKFFEYKDFFFGRDEAIIDFTFDIPCEYQTTKYDEIEKIEKLLTNKNYTIQDIQRLLKNSKNGKWYFSIEENITFYENDL